MKKIIVLVLFSPIMLFAQVGIGTTSPSASLQITSSNQATPANTDGILIPKIDDFPATSPGLNQDGMLVYLTTAVTFASIDYTEGFHYWDWNTVSSTGRWVPITSIERINDLLDGKSDVDGTEDGSSVFLGIGSGTADDSTDNRNVAIGFGTLNANVEGHSNVAIGYNALNANVGTDTPLDGIRNTAIGHSSLSSNTTGRNNTAIGAASLGSNTTGISNNAIGAFSLNRNTIGINNNALGNQALRFNVSGEGNTAIGDYALKGSLAASTGNVGSGDFNVAIGSQALEALESGNNNIAIGYQAGNNMVSNNGSVFIGYQAGFNETNGDRLYINNSNADQNGALIYGRFDIDMVRVNGEFQIGNAGAANTGYAFPTARGTADQILVTNGSGAVTWEDQPVTLASMSIARATLSANQTLTTTNYEKLNFVTTNTGDFDLNSDFDSPNNEFDVNADGTYRITAMFTSTANVNTANTFGIRIRAGGNIVQEAFYKHMNENSKVVRQISTLVQLSDGDTITVEGRSNSTLITFDATSSLTSFSVERVR